MLTAESNIVGFSGFVIARSKATKQSSLPFRALDCFASLAMTKVGNRDDELERRR